MFDLQSARFLSRVPVHVSAPEKDFALAADIHVTSPSGSHDASAGSSAAGMFGQRVMVEWQYVNCVRKDCRPTPYQLCALLHRSRTPMLIVLMKMMKVVVSDSLVGCG